ncbi:MAG: response regulator, partial [Planctomycetota bacterium]
MKPRTVLFIDDDHHILKSLKRSLQLEPFSVVTTSSPVKALKILEEDEIHVIVADLKMPKMHGLDLLARAKDAHPEVIRLVLSAMDDSRTLLSAINNGDLYRYIVKPWDTVELKFTIRQAIDLFNLRCEKRDLLLRLEEHNLSLEKQVRQRTEQLLAVERKAEIGKYASQIVHNLGNPLQVVLGGIDLLELKLQGNEPLYHELVNYIDMIKNSAMDIGAIIGGILNYAREGAPCEAEEVNLNAMINDQINFFMVNPFFKHKVKKHIYLSEEIPLIRAAPIQVKQIIDNLIKNAIDA